MYFETGSFRRSLPSSISIMIPTLVIAFDIDAIRKIVSVFIGASASMSRLPYAASCATLPCRTTIVTMPASRWCVDVALHGLRKAIEALLREAERLGRRRREALAPGAGSRHKDEKNCERQAARAEVSRQHGAEDISVGGPWVHGSMVHGTDATHEPMDLWTYVP